MTDLEKYNKVFVNQLVVPVKQLPGLRYKYHPRWDSYGHMSLVSAMEEQFGIQLSTLDVLDFSSYEKGKEILRRYGVEL